MAQVRSCGKSALGIPSPCRAAKLSALIWAFLRPPVTGFHSKLNKQKDTVWRADTGNFSPTLGGADRMQKDMPMSSVHKKKFK